MVDILSYPESTIGPTMVGHGEKNFKIKVLRRLENANLKSGFANALNKSSICMLFQLLYKVYVTLNSSKVT